MLMTTELIWLTHLLRDLMILILKLPLLLCDNKSTLFLAPTLSPTSVPNILNWLDYYFLQKFVVAGKQHTQYVHSHLQIVDIFAKSVSRPLFQFFQSNLYICSNLTLGLRGIEDLRSITLSYNFPSMYLFSYTYRHIFFLFIDSAYHVYKFTLSSIM